MGFGWRIYVCLYYFLFMKFSSRYAGFFVCGGRFFFVNVSVDFDDVNLGERRLDSKVYGHVA